MDSGHCSSGKGVRMHRSTPSYRKPCPPCYCLIGRRETAGRWQLMRGGRATTGSGCRQNKEILLSIKSNILEHSPYHLLCPVHMFIHCIFFRTINYCNIEIAYIYPTSKLYRGSRCRSEQVLSRKGFLKLPIATWKGFQKLLQREFKSTQKLLPQRLLETCSCANSGFWKPFMTALAAFGKLAEIRKCFNRSS